MENNIWYIHPYSGGPGLGNSSRPFFLASSWLKAGTRATVISCSWHHLMSVDRARNGIETIEGVPYLFVPAPRYVGNGLARIRNMFAFCKELIAKHAEYEARIGRPSMIVASSPHPYCFIPAWFLARKWKARLVFEVRDLWPLSLIELAGVSRWHPLVLLTAAIEWMAYRHADVVVSLLPGAREHMEKRGLSADRFCYIPNGAHFASDAENPGNADECREAVLEFAAKLRDEGKFVIVYPGALGPPNNMLPLVEAAALLAASGEGGIHFVVMGQGGERGQIEDRVRALGLNNFHLFPQAERSVALRLMRLASAGYVSVRRLPIYRHGISFNKLFEYMQLRLPVIFAADVPGNPVELARCGIVTSPDDPREIAASCRQLAAMSSTERVRMAERGRAYVVAHHDYEALAQRYLDLLAA